MIDPTETPDSVLDAAMERAEKETPPPAEETPADDAPADPPAGDAPADEPVDDAPADADPADDPPADDAPPAVEPTADEKLAATVAAAVAKAIAPAVQPAAAPAAETPAPEVKAPPHIARLIESDDPETKAAGEAWFEDWKESRRENAELRQRLDERDDVDLETALATELAAAVPNYSVAGADGKPVGLDPKDVEDRIEKFATDPKTKELAALLADTGGMDAVVRHLYPEAVKKVKSAAPAKPRVPGHDGSNRGGHRVPGSPRLNPGSLPRGGGGNAPPARPAKPSEPPKGEDMAACIDRAFKDLKLEA